MNYKTVPDIDSTKPLTVGAVCLFQRFLQEADQQRLDQLLYAEVSGHVKLCELAILYYASCRYYWCELPQHPLQDVNTMAFKFLEEAGFKVEHHSEGVRRKVADHTNRQQEIDAVQVRFYATATWHHLALSKSCEKEWRRREVLEDADRAKNPPRPQSTIVKGKIGQSDAIWSNVLDNKFLVEVQRIHQREFFCLFDSRGRCLHWEKANVAYGAVFGPDIDDVARWQERAAAIIGSRKNRPRLRRGRP